MATDAFAHTRNGIHHAVQVPSALAATLKLGDDPHEVANLGWDPRLEAFVGRPVGRREDVAAGMRVRDATWIVVQDGEIVEEKKIVGSTLPHALSWLQGVVAGLGVEDRELSPMGYDLPPHPAAEGHPLADLDEAVLATLHDHYARSHMVLAGLRDSEPEAFEVRLWPHHFDLGTMVPIDIDTDDGRSIGIGMSPGDGRVATPYLYVNPYPPPEGQELPSLSRGAWHTDGFVGAVLVLSEASGSDASAFVGEAVARCKELLDERA